MKSKTALLLSLGLAAAVPVLLPAHVHAASIVLTPSTAGAPIQVARQSDGSSGPIDQSDGWLQSETCPRSSQIRTRKKQSWPDSRRRPA